MCKLLYHHTRLLFFTRSKSVLCNRRGFSHELQLRTCPPLSLTQLYVNDAEVIHGQLTTFVAYQAELTKDSTNIIANRALLASNYLLYYDPKTLQYQQNATFHNHTHYK